PQVSHGSDFVARRGVRLGAAFMRLTGERLKLRDSLAPGEAEVQTGSGRWIADFRQSPGSSSVGDPDQARITRRAEAARGLGRTTIGGAPRVLRSPGESFPHGRRVG